MSPAAAAAGAGERRRPIASVRDGRGRGCGGPARAVLLGLSLVGLLLYLVPAAAALAWLTVGATAAWWGLSREPRGSRPLSSFVRKARHRRPLSSFVRKARHRRTLFASPLAKSTANGNLLEPRTLLEGPDPAELLLMGSYLGKPGPPQPAAAPEGQDLRDRPGRRPPARPAPRSPPPRSPPPRSPPPSPPTHRAHHVYPSLPTPLLRPSRRPSPRDCGTLPNRFVITPRRRYPIHQAQYSCLGVLPTVCWNGYHKKAVLSPRNSRMVCSPVTVRIAPPDRRFSRSAIPEQIISSTLSSPSSNAPDPCAKETVLSALKEKEKKRTVEEEDQIFLDGQENKRRRHDSSGSGHSAFEPLVANGVPASFVPKPGSLKRGLNSQSSDDHLNKRSRSSSMSSLTGAYASGIPSSSRNAITSSYSSTRGISQPPPPQLGYSITAEDLDLEKKASLQWFNQALEDKSDAASNSVTETPPITQPSFTFTLPAAAPASPPTSLLAPSTNPLLESLKKMQTPPSLPPCPESAGAATTEALSPPKTPSLLPPLGLSQSGPPGLLPSPSFDSKPPTTLLGLIPAPSMVPATDTKAPPTLQAETATKPQATSAPSPAPKQSFLFGTQNTSPSSPAAPAASSAPPMFKPIFTAPPKSEKEGPTPPGPSVTATAPSSSSLPTTTSTTAPTFQPVFSSMGPPASVPLPAPFFKQTTTPATAPTTTAPLFTGLASATSAVAPITSASPSTDSASKPAFGFGINSVSSSSVSTTTSTATAASQPFLFGAPQASAASFTPAMGSIFQFGKPPALPTTTTVTTFSQSLHTAVPTATSSSAADFSGFGSTLATSAPATSSQPTLTFSNTSTPTFNIPFGSSAKSPLPSYPGANPQPAFGAAEGQPPGAAKPALAPSFGSSFTFGNSAAPAAAPTPAPPSMIKVVPAYVPTPIHPIFGGATHSAFGLKATASAFGAPASSQPAFGGSTAVFFGAATSSGFGATTQTASSGSSSSVFGSTTPSPFTFGGSAAPAGSGSFGINVATPGSSTTTGAFSFGAGQSGSTATSTPFAGGLGQNALGTTGQSTPFAFNVSSTTESKPVFGGTATPTFGLNTPAPGVGTSGSSLSFGASSAPAQGFVGVAPFGSAALSFSIGAGSKTPGARQRLQARRQHTRKK
ncbi:nuclear envelope pore membrane protein POM 121 isoform 6 [Homo sapiens]|uniref:nuclear envelope pore membrane protein POM 121 isoform 6 n=2 Tax=Homo sapiens TaxID=9606 RepID=UPI0005D0259C|nr:nuclear envelope pore membrane protein POM 121 isoform 6 [Homo sapiens]|eukprot:XP_011515032.1 nuclear envelope pore membrane protein POM 121 isoform X3 [Homo sapiens]